MNYKKALELKDAGMKPSNKLLVYCPTLEEVIEELGDKFGRLEYETFKEFKTGVPSYFAYESNELRNINESGATPLEAVCNLYIKLNSPTK